MTFKPESQQNDEIEQERKTVKKNTKKKVNKPIVTKSINYKKKEVKPQLTNIEQVASYARKTRIILMLVTLELCWLIAMATGGLMMYIRGDIVLSGLSFFVSVTGSIGFISMLVLLIFAVRR